MDALSIRAICARACSAGARRNNGDGVSSASTAGWGNRWEAPQGPGQGLGGLPIGPPAVQQVARQQQQVGLPLPGQPGQTVQQFPLLLPPGGRLLRRQAGKGAVQMQVRPVDQFDHGKKAPFPPDLLLQVHPPDLDAPSGLCIDGKAAGVELAA